ncbi:uncharacterized protein G2W53_041663 [Senna tora]|uniref:Uncharacterized protein n=1 Tax=Senna tora TaxID=362788 RepID=A0A834VYZ0_9FABA|nr:uncharacterized protein G2W53_041663 [Senna tora]
MLQLELSWHSRSVDHVLTNFGQQIAVETQKPSRITRQKTCCTSESNTSVRVVFGNQSGFDAPIGVVLACEERGSCLNIFQTTNRSRISETFTNCEAKDLLRKNLNELRGKRLGAQVNQTRQFTLYLRTGVVLMLQLESSSHGRSVDHVLTYSGRKIAVGSQKHSRITRQMTCCATDSNTSVRVVFANRSGYDAPIAVVMAWEERGSCINILRRTNRGRISETFTNYEAKDLLRNRHGMGRPWIMSQHILDDKLQSDLRNLHELRGKRLVAQSDLRNLHELRGKILVAPVSQTRGFTLYLRTVVVLMLQLESSWHGMSVDNVLTYFGRQIAVGSQKPSRITRQKTCCAKSVDHVLTNFGQQIAVETQKPSRITRQKTCCTSESNTSVRVVFGNQSGFDAPIGVVLACEERGSCLNIFQTTNRSRISETFTNCEAKDLLRKNLNELRGKRLVAQVNQTRQFALYLRTGVVLMLQLESSSHGRSVDHVLTYSGRKIAVRSHKHSRITRQMTCCATESNTSVRVVFANRSGYDAPIAVVMAWEERGSCINILRRTNRGRISETFTNYEAKDLLRNESNMWVRVVLSNRSGFDAPIGVVLAWEARGSCINIFRTTNRGRISETFTNYEAKDLLRK